MSWVNSRGLPLVTRWAGRGLFQGRRMLKKWSLSVAIAVALGMTLVVQGQAPRRTGPAPGDWPELRGPSRDGISTETGLLNTWKLNGENFLWRVPYGGRSA